MSEIQKIKRLTDSINESRESKRKFDDAQNILADFLKKKNPKDLNKAFSLINEANKLDPKSVDPYLALSCMYYIKNKKEIALGILYKAKEFEKTNQHLNQLILDIENELINILIQKNKSKNIRRTKS